MKVLALCFTLLVAATAVHIPRVDPTVTLVGNAIDNQIRNTLEYIRQQLKTNEPLLVPDIPEQDINEPNTKIYLTGHFKEVYVSKASNFIVNHIENNLIGLWAKYAVTVPALHIDGKYDIKGTALGMNVNGQGTFTTEASNLVAEGFIQMDIVDHAMHMKDLKLNYTIQGLTFKEEGLVVEGVSQEQLEELLNKSFLNFFQNNKELVCGKIARVVKLEANEIMKGIPLLNFMQWLKDFWKLILKKF